MTTMKATLNALHQIGVYNFESNQIKNYLGFRKQDIPLSAFILSLSGYFLIMKSNKVYFVWSVKFVDFSKSG